jgi:hypothetical protein
MRVPFGKIRRMCLLELVMRDWRELGRRAERVFSERFMSKCLGSRKSGRQSAYVESEGQEGKQNLPWSSHPLQGFMLRA